MFQKFLLASLCLSIASLGFANDVILNPNPQTTQAHRNDQTTKVAHDNALIKPAVAPLVKNNKPNRITSTIKGDPATQRAFNWFTSDVFADAKVKISTRKDMKNPVFFDAQTDMVESHYIERDKKGFFIFKRYDDDTGEIKGYFTDQHKNAPWFPKDEAKTNERTGVDVIKAVEAVYKVHATGLKPNTIYYYQVGNQGNWSSVGQFKTAGTKEDGFSFIQYTDTQNAYYNEHINNEARYAADTLNQAQKIKPDAHFVLHTGDFVELAEAEDEWIDLMSKSQQGLLKMSLVPVAGNHDEFGINSRELFLNKFNDHFNVDSAGKIDGGSYYSFTYNNAHFVVLNTNDYKNIDKKAIGFEQMNWLKEDVKKARENGAQWVILTYHKPLFSKGYHSLQDLEVQKVRDEFMQTIDELGVDLALQGHDHVYSRTKPLSYALSAESFVNAKIEDVKYSYNGNNIKTFHDPKGTIFMVPNTAGTKSYDIIYDRPLSHIHKIRPRLNWLTQSQLEHYNSLFEVGFQPQRSKRFEENIGNYRDNTIQNFAVYTINGRVLNAQIYQVFGDLSKNEKRQVIKVDEFNIEK
ncbi:MAG: metallophosphoesterase family protein [Moraxella sp.]|nr:metallophosphoesterase family protein [Moraxella sp.]